MDKKEIKERVLEEEDFIKCPKYNNSLQKFLSRHTEGVENATISRLLLLDDAEIEQIYQEAIKLLQEKMVGK